MSKIAFVGLGVMGYPIAGHLSVAGHDVCVFNRSEERRVNWIAEYSGRWAAFNLGIDIERFFAVFLHTITLSSG